MNEDEDMVMFTKRCVLITLKFLTAMLVFMILILWSNTHRNPIEVFFT